MRLGSRAGSTVLGNPSALPRHPNPCPRGWLAASAAVQREAVSRNPACGLRAAGFSRAEGWTAALRRRDPRGPGPRRHGTARPRGAGGPPRGARGPAGCANTGLRANRGVCIDSERQGEPCIKQNSAHTQLRAGLKKEKGKWLLVSLLLPCSCSVASDSLRPHDCSPPGSSVHGISQQEYWSGLPRASPGDLSEPGIEPAPLRWQAGFFTSGLLGSPGY